MMDKIKILVVEDDESVAELCTCTLQEAGYEVTTAANGIEALERLRDRRYDLILSDIRMPVLDGIGLKLRAVTEFPYLNNRFVFMSASLNHEAHSFFLRTKTRCIAKPFLIKELINEVEWQLRAVLDTQLPN
ncbi:MAG: response regulator [Deltaproteobacteria bacterium]|nr:response regulator [Deltaproteobacteria bacterium]